MAGPLTPDRHEGLAPIPPGALPRRSPFCEMQRIVLLFQQVE